MIFNSRVQQYGRQVIRSLVTSASDALLKVNHNP